MAAQYPTATPEEMIAFHVQHFPSAPVPLHLQHGATVGAAPGGEVASESYEEEQEDLGFYPDGVPRTLTDEQIAMFRNSEARSIVRARVREQEAREERDVSELLTEAPDAPTPGHPAAGTSSGSTPANREKAAELVSTEQDGATEGGSEALEEGSDAMEVDSDEMEGVSTQKYTTSSERTKKRNKRNRLKYRHKKREEEKQRRLAELFPGEVDGGKPDDVIDEWDPRAQATGPDAITDDFPKDLDY